MNGVDLSREEAGPVTGSGAWSTLRRRLGRLGMACLVVIGALGLVALLCPVLPLADPGDVDLTNAFAPPGYDHPLGTDAGGRDILARLVWGSRAALLGPLLVTIAATTLGVVLAVLAAWRRGFVDSVISRGFDITFAFPGILLALLVAAVTGAGFAAAVTALSLAYVPYIGRVTRGAALQQLRLPYVAALIVQGQSPVAICAPSPPAQPGHHHPRPGHRRLRLCAGRPRRPVVPGPWRRPGLAGLGLAGRLRPVRHPRRPPGAVAVRRCPHRRRGRGVLSRR